MEDKTVKYSIEILDKWSNGLNKFNSSVDSANRKVGALNASLSTSSKSPHNDVKKSLSQLRSQLSRYKEASENSFRSDHIARYNRMIKETEKQIESLEGRSNKERLVGLP
jgi:cob(I)alamin adenosyltransferase